MLIKPKSPRWYRDENGVVKACYSMPKKSGNGIKEPTIADARELGLLPSVTTILSVLAKPGLERWKIEQAIHSALTLPRIRMDWDDWWVNALAHCACKTPRDMMEWAYDNLPGYDESEDAFAQRVVQDMDAQSAKAAELGTRIHDAIADYFSRNYTEGDPTLRPFLESFYVWANDNIEEVHAVEKVVGGKHCGYAGRLDLDCTLRGVGRCVVDFKSQAVKEGKEPKFYDDWVTQLGAYAKTINDPVPSIVSLVIDSRSPGPVWPKIWDRHEVFKGLQVFRHCFELWKLINDYEPCNQ